MFASSGLYLSRFTVELLSGPYVVLHVDFRFGCEHAIVLNSKLIGSWGAEVRVPNPLKHSDHFHITIKAHHSHYSLHVNGEHVAEFHHRIPMESVQAIGFRGEGHVEKVHFENFSFEHGWHHHHDEHHFGHAGWIGYGTESYSKPTFAPGHHIQTFF